MLDIVPHPHHQSLEDGFLIGDIDVIAGEQLNNLRRGEQQELLVLNDLQEVFLEQRGDGKEADNHQSLAEEGTWCSSVCLCACVLFSIPIRTKWQERSRKINASI